MYAQFVVVITTAAGHIVLAERTFEGAAVTHGATVPAIDRYQREIYFKKVTGGAHAATQSVFLNEMMGALLQAPGANGGDLRHRRRLKV